MTGLGRAVADELSAAAAKLSTTAPEATAPSQLSSASTAASLPGTLSVVPAAAAQPTPAWPVDGASDPTGTALGGALQIVNTFVIPNADYDAALSQQVGFFVYNGGIIFFPGFVTTLGNGTTNAGGHVGVVEDHEAVHVWQSRIFGPFFQVSYVAWLAGGAIVGTAV